MRDMRGSGGGTPRGAPAFPRALAAMGLWKAILVALGLAKKKVRDAARPRARAPSRPGAQLVTRRNRC